jgi:acylphosphatase
MQKTVHVIVDGRVQGVFFRDYTRRQANLLELKGWARNLPDGAVEIMISGPHEKVDAMIEWFQIGSPLSTVVSVNVEEVLPTEELHTFTIRY